MNYKICFFIIFILFYIIYNLQYINYKICQCNIKNVKKRKTKIVWEYGNYIDLGANNGDSILWFYNKYLSYIKSTVPYPKIILNITKNFNTYIFEANPFLCSKIYKVVSYLKQSTGLVNFFIYCPVIVSVYDGTGILTIDNWDVASSKYYESNSYYNKRRRNYTLPVINFTNFIIENIPSSNFNVMKFDVEGEEYFIIPELMNNDLLSKFDILYSEFHLGRINNPFSKVAKKIFNQFLNYTKNNGIETYEERKITQYQKQHHLDLYYELMKCKRNIFQTLL